MILGSAPSVLSTCTIKMTDTDIEIEMLFILMQTLSYIHQHIYTYIIMILALPGCYISCIECVALLKYIGHIC